MNVMRGDPLGCPGCGYDPMAPHNGLGDCAPAEDQPNRTQEEK